MPKNLEILTVACTWLHVAVSDIHVCTYKGGCPEAHYLNLAVIDKLWSELLNERAITGYMHIAIS